MRFAYDIFSAAVGLAGLCFLLIPRYRKRKMLWLPFTMIGGSIETLSTVLAGAQQQTAWWAGAALIGVGFIASGEFRRIMFKQIGGTPPA